jgi:hypothetical protein
MLVASLDFRRLGGHPFKLAALGPNADRAQRSWHLRMPEILKEIHAGTSVLDEHPVAGEPLGERNQLAPQLGIFETPTKNVQKVNIVLAGTMA